MNTEQERCPACGQLLKKEDTPQSIDLKFSDHLIQEIEDFLQEIKEYKKLHKIK